MKKTLKKLLICILIFVIVNNFIVGNISFADDGLSEVEGFISDMLGTVVGLLSWPIRVIAIAVGFAIQSLTSVIAYSEGSVTDTGKYNKSGFDIITPFEILFNKVALVDINFFNINWSNHGDVIYTIRTSIASWYYVMRNLAAAILLCIFIYVGIRMAISTVASEKANYKKMLVDWVCSLAIIFVLQYIMIFTLNVNSVIVNSLYEIGKGMGTGEALSESIGKIAGMSFGVTANAIGATIVYCMIVGQTLGLFFTYFNRMLKLAFLVIISPLITLTYSIDKMGDGKAQALQTWLKEFVYTVLIQPFHCIIFLVFINMALEILKGDSESQLAGVIIAMLCIKFTKDGEKLLGKIFKFGEATSDTSLAFGLGASAMALSKAKIIGSGARKGLNGLKNRASGLKGKKDAIKTKALYAKNRITGNDKEKAMQLAQDKVAEDKAKKEDKKTKKVAKKYKAKYNKDIDKEEVETVGPDGKKEKKKYNDAVNELASSYENQGMDPRLAHAKARADIAKKIRDQRINSNPKGTDKARKAYRKAKRTVKKATGTISKAKQKIFQNEAIRGMVSAGVGLATGATIYGATGKEFESGASGVAAGKALNEFMKSGSTTKNLSNSSAQMCLASGDKTGTEAALHMNNIMANSDVYENAEKYLDDLFKQLDSALQGLDESDKKTLKSSIKNVVQSEILKNPNSTNDQILEKLNSTGILNNIKNDDPNNPNNKKIEDTIKNMCSLQRDATIYNNMKDANSYGLSSDAFVASTLKQFERTVDDMDSSNAISEEKKIKEEKRSKEEKTSKEETKANVSEVVNTALGKAEAGEELTPEIIEKLTEEETRKAIKEIEKEIKKFSEQELDLINNGEGDSEKHQSLETKIERLIGSKEVLNDHKKDF